MLLCTFTMNVLTLTTIYNIVRISSGRDEECRVLVPEYKSWPEPYLFVPLNSQIVQINCTATSESPFWSVDLGNDSTTTQYRAVDPELNVHGVYALSPITSRVPSVLRLLINNTSINNQTVIYCNRRGTGLVALSSTLFVFQPSTFAWKETSIKLNSINVSWIRQPQSTLIPRIDMFSLEITRGSSSEVMFLNESYYMFTAPEGAPHCGIYNFSILNATYVGATYIGAGCSVPSEVLSIMLSSVPNISQLESSLDYVLMKQTTGFALYISFEPASYCKDYPIMNYTLELNGTRNEKILVSVFAENFTIVGDLSKNSVYSFRIHVANTVGVVSTSDREFYTTDVQVVTATLIEGVNASTIQCEFIEDSNATGCIVVLTTINGQKVYYNSTRNQSTNSTAIAVTLDHPPSCYSGVEAFDIESNGSVGSLAIPGHIVNPSQAPCTPSTLPVKPRSSGTVLEAWMIAMISVVVVIIPLTAVIIVIVGVCRSKKSQERVLGCPCMCQCLADAQVEPQVRIQVVNLRNESISEEHLSDQLKDDAGESITAAEGGMKTACYDMATNCQLESVALYSEIASTSKLGKCTTPGGGGGKSENVHSEPGSKGPLTKRGKTSVPLEEKLYDQPVDAIGRIPGDGTDYCRTSYCQQTSPVLMNDLSAAHSEGVQYATLDQNKDHIYFTLEPDRPPLGVIPSPTSPQVPIVPDTQVPSLPVATPASPPPIYQEITEISNSKGVSATRAVTFNGGSNTLLSSTSPSHVKRSLTIPVTDSGATDTSN